MSLSFHARQPTPFRRAGEMPFVAGAPQEEALARLEYLCDHGGGWAALIGPPGIGKSALLAELVGRARRRGEDAITVDRGSNSVAEFRRLLADAWPLDVAADCADAELRRRLEDHLRGFAALRRSAWVLIDGVDELTAEMQSEIRWLAGIAVRCGAPLTAVVACRHEEEGLEDAADLRFALWPWETSECGRFVAECCRRAELPDRFTRDGVAALAERAGGVPGQVAKLAEWSWLAAEAEAEPHIAADLIHAVADELSPTPARRSSYELSAAYGAW